jgi:tellurium resistance protein TerZ
MSLNLTKGQRLSLTKGDGTALAKIILGLGWDITPSAGTVDLDASCATFDKDKRLLETVYFGDKSSRNGAIKHSGDNLTGEGDGDDEQIVVDLPRIGDEVQSIVFTVTSYQGQKFDVVDNAFVRIVDASSGGGAEICRYNLSEKRPNTAMIMAKLYRYNGQWKVAALGEAADGRTISHLTAAMQAVL